MASNGECDIGAIFDEGSAIDEAMKRAGYRAVWRHRRLGVPLVFSKDGEVIEVDPFDVEIPEEYDPEPDLDTYEWAARAGFQ